MESQKPLPVQTWRAENCLFRCNYPCYRILHVLQFQQIGSRRLRDDIVSTITFLKKNFRLVQQQKEIIFLGTTQTKTPAQSVLISSFNRLSTTNQ